MFSTDKNIETISQLLQLARHYLGLQGEYLKLDITEKAVRLITALLLFIVFMLLFIAILTYRLLPPMPLVRWWATPGRSASWPVPTCCSSCCLWCSRNVG